MDHASLPILVVTTPAARALLGRDVSKVALLAVQAMLRQRKSIEIAHQQVRYGRHVFAFSSRVGRDGDLILQLDIGDPALGDRVILETDLRRAELQQAARERDARSGWRRPPR
jgi:hypothetical protein